uniref:Trimethylguanosine synthase n=1 Tax=viral metagenome TaxID=1070528 RepID=A0A6C0JQF3_9ZZZZ
MEDLFPRKEGIDYRLLKTTDEGSYSITRRRDAERIMIILRNIFKNMSSMTITDATGCIGGDTLNFASQFSHVHSIEINEQNFDALSNNVNVYGYNNITLYHGDAVKLYNWNTNVLYIDPPWGGKDYKKHKYLDLTLSGLRLDCWLEQILSRKNRPQFIALKLPANYNFNRLNFLINVDHIRPYQIRTYVLVIITVHPLKTESIRASSKNT